MDKKPKLKLVGEDGNAFAILGAAHRSAIKFGWSKEHWNKFHKEATSGDYDNLLMTCMKYFNCDGDDDDDNE